jgi:hypothetical protein
VARLITGFVLFQAGWLACVLGAARGWGWIGLALGLTALAGNLALSPRPRAAITLVAVAALIGPPFDLIQVALGTLRLHEPLLCGFWTPPWLWMLWLLFAATVHASFRWLRGRHLAAAALGAVSGAASYWAGARLGAAALHPAVWPSLLAIGLEWALMMPLLLWLSERTEVWTGSSPRAAAPGTEVTV